jgi:hypothetical protein
MKSFETLKMAEKKRDNNPKHTFKKVTQWFKDSDIQMLP